MGVASSTRTTKRLAWGLIALGAVGTAIALLGRQRGLPRPQRAAAVGDSLTAHRGYVNRLAATLGGSWSVLGYVGQGVDSILRRVRGQLTGYDTVVVLAGVNDLASGRGTVVVVEGLAGLYREARRGGARVVAVTLTPWRGAGPETEMVNQWIRGGAVGLADGVVDTSELGDASGRLLPQYSAADGLHLNAAGQQALGDLIARSFAG